MLLRFFHWNTRKARTPASKYTIYRFYTPESNTDERKSHWKSDTQPRTMFFSLL